MFLEPHQFRVVTATGKYASLLFFSGGLTSFLLHTSPVRMYLTDSCLLYSAGIYYRLV